MPSDFWNEKEVKTKKDHICFGCGRVIPAGSKVYHGSGRVWGDFNSVYNCEYCHSNHKDYCDGDGVSHEMDGFEYLREQNMNKAIEILLKKYPELKETGRYFLELAVECKFGNTNKRHFDFFYKKTGVHLFSIYVPIGINDKKTEDDKFYCID